MFKIYKIPSKYVEAVQFLESNKDMIFNSLTGQFAPDFEDGKPIIKVTTIHGDIACIRIGDWIVKEPEPGFYYPVKNEMFISHYEEEKKSGVESKCGNWTDYPRWYSG